MTSAQAKAYQAAAGEQCLQLEDAEQVQRRSLAWLALHPRGRVVLDVGFGMGDALLAMAQAAPETLFLGVEVYRPGIGAVLHRAAGHLDNILVLEGDVVEWLSQLKPASVDAVHVFFPDPWHKKKHHKRRLMNATYLQQLAPIVRTGGMLHVATDWEPYAEAILADMVACELWQASEHGYVSDQGDRPSTKYERRGQRLGHRVVDLKAYR